MNKYFFAEREFLVKIVWTQDEFLCIGCRRDGSQDSIGCEADN